MKVGFIGLGTQGKYLAINLAAAGHDLMVYDVREEPLNELRAAGAKIACSSKEVGAHAEITEVCVLDDAQVEAVVLGPDGVFAGASPQNIVVVHSTIDPVTIAKLAEAGRHAGIEIVDAAVSGSERGARERTMTYMVGASVEAFARCRPLFATSGEKITHTGDVGTGIRTKLAHQLIICVNILSAYEGYTLGLKAGVDANVLEKVIHDGSSQSKMADAWLKANFAPHTRGVFHKDLQLCLKLAHDLGIPVPGAALAQQFFELIAPKGRR